MGWDRNKRKMQLYALSDEFRLLADHALVGATQSRPRDPSICLGVEA